MIEIKNLSFKFGKLRIFDNFNLEIPKGEVVLITGINGVGKTTLLRLIAGVLKPLKGEIKFSNEISNDPRRCIGFISDKLSLYESLTVSQAIDFHKSIYGISNFDDFLIKFTKIKKGQKLKQLSIGQRAIFHLTLILSTNPKILLIDEIIHSIDVYLRNIFIKELIKLISEKMVTVVLVNLNFYDIENILDRVILLKNGKIAVNEKIDTLKTKVKKLISTNSTKSLPVISQIDYLDHSEYFIYPYKENYRKKFDGEVIDLNLTEIVSAFIGGEYA